jgi:hypothetical protein
MAITDILASLDEEIARLQQVRALLGAGGDAGIERNAARSVVTNGIGKRKRVMSAEARARIAAAQRARWAKQKKAAK